MTIEISNISWCLSQAVADKIDKSGISKNDNKLDEIEIDFFKKQIDKLHEQKLLNDDEFKDIMGLNINSEDSDKGYGIQTFENHYKTNDEMIRKVEKPSTIENIKQIAKGAGIGAIVALGVPLFLCPFATPMVAGALIGATLTSSTMAAGAGILAGIGAVAGATIAIKDIKNDKHLQECIQSENEYYKEQTKQYQEAEKIVEKAINEYKTKADS